MYVPSEGAVLIDAEVLGKFQCERTLTSLGHGGEKCQLPKVWQVGPMGVKRNAG
jgi:hypothetical protein